MMQCNEVMWQPCSILLFKPTPILSLHSVSHKINMINSIQHDLNTVLINLSRLSKQNNAHMKEKHTTAQILSVK